METASDGDVLPFDRNVIDSAKKVIEDKCPSIDPSFDLCDFLIKINQCLSQHNFKKECRLELLESYKHFITAFEAIINLEHQSSNAAAQLKLDKASMYEFGRQVGRESKALQQKYEQIQSEHEALDRDLFDSTQLCKQQQLTLAAQAAQHEALSKELYESNQLCKQQQLMLAAQKAQTTDSANYVSTKQNQTTRQQRATEKAKTTNHQNAPSQLNSQLNSQLSSQLTNQPDSQLKQQQRPAVNVWNHINKKVRQAPRKPIATPQQARPDAPVRPRNPAPLPLVFTLPAVKIDDNLKPADAKKVKAEVLVRLNAWSTGIKVKSISMNAACGKVFVRMAEQKDVDKAFEIMDKAVTDDSSELEIRQLQHNSDAVFFLPGIPNSVKEEDVIPKLIELNSFLKPALNTMCIKKKIMLKNNTDEYAVILSVGKEHADIFKQRKILVGYYRKWIQPALRKPFCGKCHRLGHFTKECTDAYVNSAAALGPETCVNCTEYNAKLGKSKDRNPDDKRSPRDTNHCSTRRQICLSYLSAVGKPDVSHNNA